MKALHAQARRNPDEGAACLAAFLHADPAEQSIAARARAAVGAKLFAEALIDLRILREALTTTE